MTSGPSTTMSQAGEAIIIVESQRRRDDEATLRDDTLQDVDRDASDEERE